MEIFPHEKVKKKKLRYMQDFLGYSYFLETVFFLRENTLRKTSSIGEICLQWRVSCCKQATESTLN